MDNLLQLFQLDQQQNKMREQIRIFDDMIHQKILNFIKQRKNYPILVKDLEEDRIYEINVCDELTVHRLKFLVKFHVNRPIFIYKQRLFLANQELENKSLLSDYNIQKGNLIHLEGEQLQNETVNPEHTDLNSCDINLLLVKGSEKAMKDTTNLQEDLKESTILLNSFLP